MNADVVVAGGGPTGLMLACELGLAGVRPIVLERLPAPSEAPRANGLGGQIIPTLDFRGLLERFSRGAPYAGPVPSFPFGGLPLKLYKLGASPVHVLLIPQRRLEELLAERAGELRAEIRRGHELRALTQDDDAVTLTVDGPEGAYELRTRYLIGCDGGNSLVRRQAGIGFPGTTDRRLTRIAHTTLPPGVVVSDAGEVEVPGHGPLRPGWNHTPRGSVTVASLQPGVHIFAVGEDDADPVDPSAPMTLEELQASARRVLGAELPVAEPIWLSRFALQSRLATTYRAGRVLLAGDAAHLFNGGGGAPLNVGLMDTVNLGWKLAAQIRGDAPPGLLDTYHAERHPVARRTLTQTRVQSVLLASGEEADALRELFADLLEDTQPITRLAHLMSGADIIYDMPAATPTAHRPPDAGSDPAMWRAGADRGRHDTQGPGGHIGQEPPGAADDPGLSRTGGERVDHGEPSREHISEMSGVDLAPHPSLLGRFAPDLALSTAEGTTRVAELMRAARPVLLDLADRRSLREAAAPWKDRIDVVTAYCDRPPGDALLIRPDGYVAWAAPPAEPDQSMRDGLRAALTTWFGAAA